MVVKVGINGFGHIDRSIVHASLKNSNVQVSTAYGPFKGLDYKADKYTHWRNKCWVSSSGNQFLVNDQAIAVVQSTVVPWCKHKMNYVVELADTTIHRDTMDTDLQQSEVKKLVISTPSTDTSLLIIDVRLDGYKTSTGGTKVTDGEDDAFARVVKGLVATIHDIVATQTTEEDLCDKDKYITDKCITDSSPTETISTFSRVTKAQAIVISKLDEKMFFRTFAPDVSVGDLITWLERPTSYDEIKATIKKLLDGDLQSIIDCSEVDTVPTDFAGDGLHSRVFDSKSDISQNSPGARLEPWYHHDFGSYPSRMMNCVPQIA